MKSPDAQFVPGFTEAEWLACENPARLVKRFRVGTSPRKYQLLACAYAIDVPHAGLNQLDLRPAALLRAAAFSSGPEGLTRAAARELLLSHFSGPGHYEELLSRWCSATPWPRPAHEGPDILDELVGAAVWWGMGAPTVNRTGATVEDFIRRAAHRDASDHLRRVVRHPPAHGPREAVLRLLPPQDRDELRRVAWGGGRVPGRILRCFQAAVSKRRIEKARRAMADLFREVMGNPFRRPVLDPAWLLCNHGAARHIAEQIATSGNLADMPILADALEDAGCADEELLRHCREKATHVPGCWALDAVLGRV